MNVNGRNTRFIYFLKQSPMTASILILNLLMYLLTIVSGSGNIWNGASTSTLIQFGAQYGPYVSNGEWYRLMTANFLHGGLLHLFFNSYALFYFGIIVEKVFTSQKFIFIYIISGVVGNLLTQVFFPSVPSVGASGAIFGLIGLMFAAGINGTIQGRLRGFAGTALLPMILINLFLGFTVPGINNYAHIGGLATGFLLGFVLSPNAAFHVWQRKFWLVVQYICIALVVICLILNFVNIKPSVDKVISFHNTFVRMMSDTYRLTDKSRYSYYTDLLDPVDGDTRHLKEMAENYFKSNGTDPDISVLQTEFKSWQSEILDIYDLSLQSE
ncbi:MAG TPA: rhomboid family intramembrane serine protease [Thermotogota bacterium]|nr:rhomboid family intramembrane serine protease [Thermotogota bacterium]HPJ87902.1 rhomboid family intramembrane serine protease [Thermotogota bacterium]HPR94995.1 rhomboid family intramembrane serine protease [Thermotogota bacterium]